MVKSMEYIAVIGREDLKGHSSFVLRNCVVGTIDLIGVFDLEVHLTIENCVVESMLIHSCWFSEGCTIKNSVIVSYVDYQMGGHNLRPIVLEGNVFNEFFNFFDCQFNDVIEVRNNIFLKGANILGNKGEGFENTFAHGCIVEGNIGSMDVDGEGYD